MSRLALLALALALLLAPGVEAAGVTLERTLFEAQGGDQVLSHLVGVEARPGEVNDISVDVADGAVTVRDAGAALTAGKRCAAVDAATVRCALVPPRACDPCEMTRVQATLRLGDGDDRAALTPPASRALSLEVYAQGEAGDDVVTSPGVLEGGDGDDQLTGAQGDDALEGGPGADVLRGLGGRDQLAGDSELQEGTDAGPKGDDVLDGGPGRDSAAYSARDAPLTLDLAAGTGGQAGEADRLLAIEDVDGGRGGDRIFGTDGDNRLNGGGGPDTIVGLAGDDDVGDGAIDAGAGDDRVSRPRGAFACGAGTDVVAGPPRRRALPDDCELVALHLPLVAAAHPTVGPSGVRIALRSTCRCAYRVALTARRGDTVLARGRARVARAPRDGSRRLTARLPLTAAGRAALDAGAITATITVKRRRSSVGRYLARLG